MLIVESDPQRHLIQSGTLLDKQSIHASPDKLSPQTKQVVENKKAKKSRRGGMLEHLVEQAGVNNVIFQVDRKQREDTVTMIKDAMLMKLSKEALSIKKEHFLAMRDLEKRKQFSMLETRDEADSISDIIT